MSSNQRIRVNPPEEDGSDHGPEPGILNEQILQLVFESMKWDLPTLCATARVNRKLRAVAKRILWRELCIYRAPRMVAALVHGLPGTRIGGGWQALAKLLFFCCGCQPSQNFRIGSSLPGHFVKESRFSKTSGRSFLTRQCRGDLLYVSDPCEHAVSDGEDDLGVYRGVFRGFMRSQTRATLIGRQVQLEERVRCPYCGARVWSMTTARMVPKSAALRLGTHEGGLEYFVCINGHLHGSCWLVPLSTDEERERGEEDEDEDDIGEDEQENHEERDFRDSSSSHVNGEAFNQRGERGDFPGCESSSSAGDDIYLCH